MDLMTDEAFLEAVLSFMTSIPTADIYQEKPWQQVGWWWGPGARSRRPVGGEMQGAWLPMNQACQGVQLCLE